MVWLPDGEKISKTCLFVLAWSANVTEGRMDRQRDEHRMTAIAALMHSIARQKPQRNGPLFSNTVPPGRGGRLLPGCAFSVGGNLWEGVCLQEVTSIYMIISLIWWYQRSCRVPVLKNPAQSPPRCTIHQRPVYQLHIIRCGTIIAFAI